jgi:predicted porin
MKMKHTLIAVAAAGLASAAVVTPAMADATAYGLAQVEITSYSNQQEAGGCNDQSAAAGEGGCDGLKVQDRSNGRVGFKASEDLGNGWTGLAKAEFQVNYANGGWATSPTNAAREAMVGLKGSGITIEAGNLKSAYKYTGGVKYDPFVATSLEARRDNGGMWHTAFGQGGFLARSLAVKGGSGPVKFWVTYAPGEGDHFMTASVMYSQGDVEAFVAMSDQGDLSATADSATKIGGAYKLGPTKIKLQYEMVDRDLTPSQDETFLFLGVEHKMGKNTFVAQLGQYDSDSSANPNTDTSYFALGVIHKFTKMTRVWAGLRSSDADDKSDEDAISIGLRKDF